MIIVGEKINATNRSVGQALAGKDTSFLQDLAKSQADAGADYIDVNVGAGHDGPDSSHALMEWLIETVISVTETPLCIDSDDPSVLKAALDAYTGDTVMINSVNAESDRLDAVGKLAAERGAAIVALVMTDEGIPPTVTARLEAAQTIMTHLSELGIRDEQIYFDPLVLPISVDHTQGMVTLETTRELKTRYPDAKTIMGLSNISYGLPNRSMISRAFLLMVVASGLDAAILNPLDKRTVTLARVADMLVGSDPGCRQYIKAHRKGMLAS